MKANSTTGDFAKSANRQFLEGYNATRGAYRGVGALVAPNTPVRFVDGEKVEDWISANSKALLGWDDPARGKGPGRNPGYTVYILNTWDSAEARAILKPQDEYHVWKINRTDPDTGDFDGIDWARIWGGRYRFMMVDTGAAPNPYEAETWGNRNRSVYGSANYDPPLWEYRANAPRPVTLVNIVRGRRAGAHAGRELGPEPAELHARPDGEPGDLVPVPPLLPLRAAPGHRPVLVLGQRLARREGGAPVGVRPEQALQPGRRPGRAADADAVPDVRGRRALRLPRRGRPRPRRPQPRRPGDARPGQAGRRRRRRRPGRLDAHRHGDGLHRRSSRASSAAALLHDGAGDQRRRREALRLGAPDRRRASPRTATASRGATSAR